MIRCGSWGTGAIVGEAKRAKRKVLTRRRLLATGGAASAAFAVGGAAAHLNRLRRHPGGRRNIYVIFSDSMRGDVIGKKIGGVEVTPNLNRFAEENVNFTSAFAASTQTKYSVASMLCGQYPQYHGVLEMDRALPPEIPTLPGMLLDMGYFCFGLTTNVVAAGEPYANRGCGYGYPFIRLNGKASRRRSHGIYRYLEPLPGDRFGASVGVSEGYRETRAAFGLHWRILRGSRLVRSGRPFFCWIHGMETHIPYIPSRPMAGVTGAFHGGSACEDEVWRGDLEMVRSVIRGRDEDGRRPVPDEAGKARIRAMTDEAALRFDRYFGKFVERLKDEGIYDNATIVFTSDHGEELWEHGGFGHSHNLYNCTLRVPLVIKHPGVGARTVGARVSNASIFPTIAELFGGEGPSGNVMSLAAHMRGETAENLPIVAALSESNEKVITPEGISFTDNNGLVECYDLNSDPAETLDLSKSGAGEAAALVRRGEEALMRETGAARAFARRDDVGVFFTEVPELKAAVLARDGKVRVREGHRLTREQQDRLKALGYLN